MIPIGPAPVIKTSSPTRLNDSAVCVALPKGSKIDARSSEISSGILNALKAGITRYSAKAPSRLTPTPTVFRHRCRRPARQLRQKPQVMCPSPETRSPILNPRTSCPISTIRPTYSWPTCIGTGIVFCAHSSHFQMCTSVPQMAVLRTRIRTSLWPTSGLFTWTSFRPGPGVTLASAFIVSSMAIGQSANGAERLADLGERGDRAFYLCRIVRGAHLGSQARLALGHDGVRKADHVNAFLEERVRKTRGKLRVTEHDRNDRMVPRDQIEAKPGERIAKALSVLADARSHRAAFFAAKELDHLERGRGDAGGHRIGKQIRTRALAQQLDDFLASRSIASRGAAQRLAQRAGDDVHLGFDSAVFGRAAAAVAHETDCVRVVDHHQRPMPFRERADRAQIGDDSVHGKNAVGGDQLEARAGRVGFVQFGLEIAHVVIAVAETFCLAKPDAVDDACVVQFIADNRVFLAEKRLEEAAVGVETARIENAVVCPQEPAQRRLELLVHGLRAADEAHRGHAEAPMIERLFRRRYHAWIVGEPEIIIGTQVQHSVGAVDSNFSRLRAFDDAFGLVEAGSADLIDNLPQVGQVSFAHDRTL